MSTIHFTRLDICDGCGDWSWTAPSGRCRACLPPARDDRAGRPARDENDLVARSLAARRSGWPAPAADAFDDFLQVVRRPRPGALTRV
ncbi:MAG: hypothetical protein R3F20_00130 [Planctomycetota bacterium]